MSAKIGCADDWVGAYVGYETISIYFDADSSSSGLVGDRTA